MVLQVHPKDAGYNCAEAHDESSHLDEEALLDDLFTQTNKETNIKCKSAHLNKQTSS